MSSLRVRWSVFELRGPTERDRLLRACLALRGLPGVMVVRVQPDRGRVAIGAVPGDPLELQAAAILVGAGLRIRSMTVGGPDPAMGDGAPPPAWPPPVPTASA